MTSIGGSVSWSGFFKVDTDLALEPDVIRQWLNECRQDIASLVARRSKLALLAAYAGDSVRLGEIPFSLGIKNKIIDRIGHSSDARNQATKGSLLAAIDNTIAELMNLHEALRRALATHLGADLEAERIMNSAGTEADG